MKRTTTEAKRNAFWQLWSWRATVAGAALTLAGLGITIWQLKGKKVEQQESRQLLKNTHAGGDVTITQGSGHLHGDGNTQVTLSANTVGSLNFGSQENSANSATSNALTGSGKQFNGGGVDHSTTIINHYYPTSPAPRATERVKLPDDKEPLTPPPEPPSTPPPAKTNALSSPQSTRPTSPGDFPGFDHPWTIRLGPIDRKRGGMGLYKEFEVSITQGDRLRIQVEPLGGAAMQIRMGVHVGARNTELEASHDPRRRDWTMSKNIPGNSARVRIYSMQEGEMSVTINKVR